jgi:hypothetical protein
MAALISGRLVMIGSMTAIVGGGAVTAPRPRG